MFQLRKGENLSKSKTLCNGTVQILTKSDSTMQGNSNYVSPHNYLAPPVLQVCFLLPLMSLRGQHQEYRTVNSRSPFHTGASIAPDYQNRAIRKKALPPPDSSKWEMLSGRSTTWHTQPCSQWAEAVEEMDLPWHRQDLQKISL